MKQLKELTELSAAIATLEQSEQAKVAPALHKLRISLNKRYESLALVQTALEQLRLDLKYLVFDLEATKQERDEFKALLEKQP